jgi:hypothetical protein
MKILPLVLGAMMAVASSSAFAHDDPVDAAVTVLALPVVVAGTVVDALFAPPPPPPPVVARY